MPLYSDTNPYYGSSQPPSYYLPAAPSISALSRISAPYSFSYMSPISAMLSASIGTNPMPRGLRSYSPMLSSISETGSSKSPVVPRREITGHRNSPRRLMKSYLRQPRPITIDTEKIDWTKRKKNDGEEESTPGLITRGRSTVRMHTRKLKDNALPKVKKTQAELLMEKYLIKDKPTGKDSREEGTPSPRRKRIWEEQVEEEETPQPLVRRGTVKRTSVFQKNLPDQFQTTNKVSEEQAGDVKSQRKMSSELLKAEAELFDCMIQEELGSNNSKEIGAKEIDNSDESVLASKRKSKREVMPYVQKKSSETLEESGIFNEKRKSHFIKKKGSNVFSVDELNRSSDDLFDSSCVSEEIAVKVKRKSTRKKKPIKFKIDSLHVEEKSSPKLLRKFKYEVIVEESDKKKCEESSSVSEKDIPIASEQEIVDQKINCKSTVSDTKLVTEICDEKCDNSTEKYCGKESSINECKLTENITLSNKEVFNESRDESSSTKSEPQVKKATKALLERQQATEDSQDHCSAPNLEDIKKQKTENLKFSNSKLKQIPKSISSVSKSDLVKTRIDHSNPSNTCSNLFINKSKDISSAKEPNLNSVSMTSKVCDKSNSCSESCSQEYNDKSYDVDSNVSLAESDSKLVAEVESKGNTKVAGKVSKTTLEKSKIIPTTNTTSKLDPKTPSFLQEQPIQTKSNKKNVTEVNPIQEKDSNLLNNDNMSVKPIGLIKPKGYEFQDPKKEKDLATSICTGKVNTQAMKNANFVEKNALHSQRSTLKEETILHMQSISSELSKISTKILPKSTPLTPLLTKNPPSDTIIGNEKVPTFESLNSGIKTFNKNASTSENIKKFVDIDKTQETSSLSSKEKEKTSVLAYSTDQAIKTLTPASKITLIKGCGADQDNKRTLQKPTKTSEKEQSKLEEVKVIENLSESELTQSVNLSKTTVNEILIKQVKVKDTVNLNQSGLVVSKEQINKVELQQSSKQLHQNDTKPTMKIELKHNKQVTLKPNASEDKTVKADSICKKIKDCAMGSELNTFGKIEQPTILKQQLNQGFKNSKSITQTKLTALTQDKPNEKVVSDNSEEVNPQSLLVNKNGEEAVISFNSRSPKPDLESVLNKNFDDQGQLNAAQKLEINSNNNLTKGNKEDFKSKLVTNNGNNKKLLGNIGKTTNINKQSKEGKCDPFKLESNFDKLSKNILTTSQVTKDKPTLLKQQEDNKIHLSKSSFGEKFEETKKTEDKVIMTKTVPAIKEIEKLSKINDKQTKVMSEPASNINQYKKGVLQEVKLTHKDGDGYHSVDVELNVKKSLRQSVKNNSELIKIDKCIEVNKVAATESKKKRIKSESDVVDESDSGSKKNLLNEVCTTNPPEEKSQSLKETRSGSSSKKKKKSKEKSGTTEKKASKSPKKSKSSEKSTRSTEEDHDSDSPKSQKTSVSSGSSKKSSKRSGKDEKKEGVEELSTTELSNRSTRLMHFVNKCVKLSADSESLSFEISDEDLTTSSSSSEDTSDSEYTSDSEEESSSEENGSSSSSSEHGSREHGSPTRRQCNAALLSLDEEKEPRHAHGHGRVTPPATTIPKFRKYAMDDFQFLKVLGKGSFGKVLLAELKGTQYYYAVKCLKKDVVLEDDDVECTLIERKVLALGTNHPYLCHLFCTFQTESHLFFVMEYLNGGDLMFHIQQQGRFDEGRARFYAAEIISGLKFLHKKGIVYRDLKLDNILLDFDGHVRIADFGMCKLQIFLDRTADTFCGTPDYMAPEIIKGLKYNQCVDWWSFGILLYEMLVGQSPFSGCDEDDLFWCICNRQPHFPRFITVEAKKILMELLEKEASKRLGSCEKGADEVMGHPFFNGLDWERLERRELVPPFKPNVKHPLDVHYFDKHFTAERACLTPIDPSILQSMDQTQFQGFSYTNPNVTE